ncbi:hypothetical protein [Burkholderia pseudomultivorans]|uniref:Uncharacterized protein n=2 Tax=Burkholderia pseudomultivorans TaxID=1207504 RepID=A0A132E875_9BURK|nr:hypothetical protein [Burkholderia pseudomultivorans]KWF18988.1 hypothetical protein WT56_30145 [Burkholderia pseudomultivorans]MDR8728532.1 hypothetical protein [Burkholderia pseudomultivorans]MDR8737238.1 hypothetical protein [Burkholderia pseudomultivorans]MDR8743231.1 hypothetical protein [Burkholderia pseudomultivorans]MDR8754792.1 hypothetical protein [Burkholderia pseudomultivorans]
MPVEDIANPLEKHRMDSLKQHVVAHAPGTPGEHSDIAARLLTSTGAACAAVVTIDPHGNGGYGVAGSLEVQLLMPDLLEQVARALRSQLTGSVQ